MERPLLNRIRKVYPTRLIKYKNLFKYFEEKMHIDDKFK